MIINGLPVIESVYAVTPGKDVVVQRTWRERLCTWPWRPFVKTRTARTPDVPAAFITIGLGGHRLLVAHPEWVRQATIDPAVALLLHR